MASPEARRQREREERGTALDRQRSRLLLVTAVPAIAGIWIVASALANEGIYPEARYWNAIVVGALIASLAVGSLLARAPSLAWGVAALGIWLLAAPLALGAGGWEWPLGLEVLLGGIVALFGAWLAALPRPVS